MTSTAAAVAVPLTAAVGDGACTAAAAAALSCSESPLAEAWSPPAPPVAGAVETTRRSFADPVLVNDRRVLDSLLAMDDRHLPSLSYFKYTQPDLEPYMRRMVVTWMMEVYAATHSRLLHLSVKLDYDRGLGTGVTQR